MNHLSSAALRDEIAKEPAAAIALTIVGGAIAVLSGIAAIVAIFGPLTADHMPELAALVAPIGGAIGGLLLMGVASVVRDVRVMRLIAQYDAEQKAETAAA